MRAKTLNTVWEMRTYDVWGNSKNGFEVNDICQQGTVYLTLRVQVANEGTLYEFAYAHPSNRQLQKVFGFHGVIDIDGDDTIVYVNRSCDGYPLGELHLVSHESLSPISWERKELE